MHSNKRLNGFLVVAALWNLASNFAHPITPTVLQNLHVNDYMFGVALSSMMTANFLFSPFWGKINGYISSKTSLLISNIGYAAAQLMFMMAKTELDVAVARFVAGIFCGGVLVSTLTYIVNCSTPETRGRALTIQATMQGICSAFGFMIGGLLGEISTDMTFVVQAVSLVLCGVLFMIVGEDDSTYKIRELSGGEFLRDVNPFAAFIQSRKFMSIVFLVLFGIATMQNLGYTAYEQSFNYYIKDQFGFSSAYNGIIKGAIGFITLGANFTICLWMLRRTNIRKSLWLVFGVCTATLLGVTLVERVSLFIVINIAYFAFNAISLPLIQNLVAEKSQGEHSNLIMGCYNAMKALGGIIGPLTAGFLYTVWPKNVFLFAGGAYLIGSVLCGVYYRMGKREQKEAPLPEHSRA